MLRDCEIAEEQMHGPVETVLRRSCFFPTSTPSFHPLCATSAPLTRLCGRQHRTKSAVKRSSLHRTAPRRLKDESGARPPPGDPFIKCEYTVKDEWGTVRGHTPHSTRTIPWPGRAAQRRGRVRAGQKAYSCISHPRLSDDWLERGCSN